MVREVTELEETRDGAFNVKGQRSARQRGSEGVLVGRFKSGSLIGWRIPWIVVSREHLMVRA